LNYTQQGQLLDFLSTVSERIEMVRFKTMEVIPRQVAYENVFAQETLFKQPGTKIKHVVYDPFQDKKVKIYGFLGQTMGKSAIRLCVEAKPKTTHKFVALTGTSLETLHTGYLLHYNCYSFFDFVKKYQNFKQQPDTWVSGNPIDRQRRIWRDMVNDPRFSEEELCRYYRKWIMFDAQEVQRLQRKSLWRFLPGKPGVVTVAAVQKAFQQISAT
jgi:hypothetical protein